MKVKNKEDVSQFADKFRNYSNPNGQKAPELQLRGFCCANHEHISSFA